ncbi:MAG: GntR family transcriptional regulator [Victivallaceae bacterium]
MKKSEFQFSSKATVIFEELKRRILNGRLMPGEMLPTTTEIARQFGVSRATINQAMAQLVSEKLVTRVRRKGTFVESPSAVSAQPRHGRDIGFYLPMLKSETDELTNYETVWIEIFSGALAAAGAAGYRLTAIPDLGGTLSENIGRYPVDGVILHGGGVRFSAFEPFIMSGLWRTMNYLLINREADFQSFNYIDEISCEDIVGIFNELIAAGHRRIGVIGSDLTAFSYARYVEAYQQAMTAAGIYDPALIKRINTIRFDCDPVPGVTEQAVRELLALKEPPTILLIYRVRFLETVMTVLKKFGVRIPQDMQVVLLESRRAKPFAFEGMPISSFVLPSKREFGELAVKKMIEIIDGNCELPVHASQPLTFSPGESWLRK